MAHIRSRFPRTGTRCGVSDPDPTTRVLWGTISGQPSDSITTVHVSQSRRVISCLIKVVQWGIDGQRIISPPPGCWPRTAARPTVVVDNGEHLGCGARAPTAKWCASTQTPENTERDGVGHTTDYVAKIPAHSRRQTTAALPLWRAIPGTPVRPRHRRTPSALLQSSVGHPRELPKTESQVRLRWRMAATLLSSTSLVLGFFVAEMGTGSSEA